MSSPDPPPSSSTPPRRATTLTSGLLSSSTSFKLSTPSLNSNGDHRSPLRDASSAMTAQNSTSVSATPGAGQGLLFHHAKQAVWWALLSNVCIFVIKLLGALFVAPSAALFSEALHSLGDAINSVTLLIGITWGSRPPDRTHPFGYGLETNFWALFASFFLFVSAGYAVYKGVDNLINPVVIDHYGLMSLILVVSIAVELIAVRTAAQAVLEEVGIEAKGWQIIAKAWANINLVVSPTTRFVFYEDSLALLGAFVVLLSIGITQLGVYYGVLPLAFRHWPDAIASIIIGVLLLILGFNLLRFNRGFLLGAAASELVESKITSIVKTVNGVSQVHDLKTIDQGLAGLIVHMSVEVEPDTPVKDVDDLTDRIKQRLSRQLSNVRQVFIEVLANETEENWAEQFEVLLEQGSAQGLLKPREKAMLRRMYDFTETVAGDVMVPRMDVEYVSVETSLTDVADLMIETGHTRLPVYEEHVDNLVGLVQARDLFEKIRQNDLDAPLKSILRELDIYPENKPITDLLEEFKRKKIKLAVIADEHGGFAGVVTIEDLLEEIVGELWDDDEQEEIEIEVLDDQRLLVNGKMEIEDLNDRYDCNIPTDEFKTIGGFVFGQLGREPEGGDQVTFEDLTLTVQEAEGARITKVLIESPTPLQPQTPPEETLYS
jgi:cation diffusion facilitator family transporter